MSEPVRLVLILTDNVRIYEAVQSAIGTQHSSELVDVARTGHTPGLLHLPRIDTKSSAAELARKYDVVISAHCKQIFPAALVNGTTCINIHPGFNPEGRGWYPQVWSIIHGHRAGFTVHLMDEQVDHGAIIHREEVQVDLADTSESVYERVLQAEERYIRADLPLLLSGRYDLFPPESEGGYFSKRDFNRLCEFDFEENGSFRDFYDRLRALSHGDHRNAFVIDPATGKRIYMKLELFRREE